MIIIYSDGSCVNKKGGYAFMIIKDKEEIEVFNKIEGECTNQIAELTAIYQSLLYLSNYKEDEIIIRSDSMYSILCLTEYMKKWRLNNYLTAKNKPIKNKQLIITTFNLLSTFTNVKFEHVYSHRGEIYNERVDKLANKGRLL